MNDYRKLDELSRRKFLHYAAKAFLGVGLGGSLATSRLFGLPENSFVGRPTAKRLIYLYMAGGMSQLDTFDPKPGTASHGPLDILKTNAAGVQFTEYLPRLAKQADKLAIIRSMTSNQGAHEQGTYFMRTSYEMRGTIKHPGLGAWLNKVSGKTNTTLPGNVRIGGGTYPGGKGFFDTSAAPVFINQPEDGLKDSQRHHSISEERLKERLELAQWMDLGFHKQVQSAHASSYQNLYNEAVALMQSSDLAAFDIRKESEEILERYGDHSFGKGCLLARRLVEHDVRCVEVNLGGWDTHFNNFEKVEENAALLDQGLAALLQDLSERGLLEETLVVVATEFGRTPDIVASANGRDHHPQSFTCLLAGGGIRGGQTFGATNETGHEVWEDAVTIPDFNATIAYALGLPLDKVIYSPTQRPFTIADKGQPLVQLF